MATTSTSEDKKKIYWQQQISNWKASGISQKKFCRRQSLALSTFAYWKRKIERPETEAATFYPLSLTNPKQQASDAGLELLLGQKRIVIKIGEDFSAVALKKLIVTLEQL